MNLKFVFTLVALLSSPIVAIGSPADRRDEIKKFAIRSLKLPAKGLTVVLDRAESYDADEHRADESYDRGVYFVVSTQTDASYYGRMLESRSRWFRCSYSASSPSASAKINCEKSRIGGGPL